MKAQPSRPVAVFPIFVPSFEDIIAWRQIADLKRAILAGHGEVRTIDNADEGVHPGMNVTLHGNQDLGLDEFPREGRIARSLTMIPFPVDFSERMNIMGDGIRIHHAKRLANLNAEHSRTKPTAS